MNTNQKLKGQSALVTGANSGIGEAVAIALGNDGANVVVNYVTHPENADAVVKQIENNGGKAIAIKADVSNESEVQSMFKQMIEKFGTIDILVNNAGIQKDSPLERMSLADWQLVINVNLTGQFLCAREAVREFLKRGVVAQRSSSAGKIICMSSVHQVIPWAGHVNYASSKGGIDMMMQSMAQEMAPKKIRINSIAPGAIRTPINKSAWDTEESLKRLLTLIPYGRVGVPEDIGKVAVWLASDESDYLVGTTVFVDGGMTLYPGFSTNG
ncbi:MAG TPA: SDR family oxidoreductase [Hanamia sp.]|jgi:glucose 1-dehydrogenase|nr:SDR family oxidoreductase [Hanamia sp.]